MTLLEATIAMVVIGLMAVAALGEFAAELRTGTRSVDARVLHALAEDRLSALRVAPAVVLTRLPDSLSQGWFPPPFGEHRWTATVKPDRILEGLYEVTVAIRAPNAQFAVSTRLFRVPPSPRGLLR
jgi:type II secretory pathway pseudopilin PulG